MKRIGWHDPGCLKVGSADSGLFRRTGGRDDGAWRWYCCDGLVETTTEGDRPIEGAGMVLRTYTGPDVEFEHRARPN